MGRSLHLVGALFLLLAAGAGAQTDWAWLHPQPQGHHLFGVAWTGSRLVAVGDFGTIVTSSDGDAWTASWSGHRSRLNAVTWTARSSGTSQELFGAAYGSGLFVAVGMGGTVLTSPDGMSWTPRNTGVVTELTAIAWADTQFVAVGGKSILTSPDGVAWTQRNSGVTNILRGVGWGDGRIVVVGDDAVVLTSEDGIGWDSVYVGIERDFFAIGRSGKPGSPGTVVMVGNAGCISSSVNFEDWRVGNPGISRTLRSVATDGQGGLVAVGDDGAILSGTGTGFTPRNSGTLNGFRSVAWARGRWVAAGWLGTSWSEDGREWTSETGPGYDSRFDLHSLAWMDSSSTGPGQWVAVGQGGVIQTSADGASWTLRDSGRASELHSVAWLGPSAGTGSGRLVAVGKGPILASQDGRSWAEVHPGSRNGLHGLAAGNGGFLAVGAGGSILTSPDGQAWREQVSGVEENLHGAMWTGRQWIVTGDAGLVLRSSDGVA